MQNFAFHQPTSLSEALAALRTTGEGKLLAGGQSLLPLIKLDLAAPEGLVSVSRLPELRGIEVEGGTLSIGAAITHQGVADSPEVCDSIPALADLAGQIGDPQVRNRGTLGGSLAHNDPAADYPAALLALDGMVVTDRREIPAGDFLVGRFATALEDDEIILRVRFSVPDAAAYAKFSSPASKYAIVGVMVVRGPSGVRVGVNGAAECAFRHEGMEAALAGEFSGDAVSGVAVESGKLLSDLEASAEYRAHLVKVMTRRAVEACA